MAEREAMFRNALEKTRRGVVACVFDTSDRVQHMFYRYLHDDGAGSSNGAYRKTIEDLYQRMDPLVGMASSYADKDTVLFVLSDHGFCSFRRGINLNSWLRDNGYLALENGVHRKRPLFQRRRLEPHARLHDGPGRTVSEYEGPRSAGHRRTRRRSRSAETGADRRNSPAWRIPSATGSASARSTPPTPSIKGRTWPRRRT